MADLVDNFGYDVRKIIALSTLRQLVLITDAVSVGFVGLVFFHLLTHALLKAPPFICAGVIIRTMKDSQDIRFMDNLSLQVSSTLPCVDAFLVTCFHAGMLLGLFGPDDGRDMFLRNVG
jgi:NADH-ubiquinone oxidoreductase chain 5